MVYSPELCWVSMLLLKWMYLFNWTYSKCTPNKFNAMNSSWWGYYCTQTAEKAKESNSKLVHENITYCLKWNLTSKLHCRNLGRSEIVEFMTVKYPMYLGAWGLNTVVSITLGSGVLCRHRRGERESGCFVANLFSWF